jgi:isoleucyl-tRNA synthetase
VIDEYGADILRLWVMNSDITEDQRIGREILKQQAELYRRIRNTLRWLLGGLDGFSDSEIVPYAEMPDLEKFILHRVAELDRRVRRAVQTYDWAGVVPELHGFCATDLSAFYFDIRKDALYCDRPDSIRRRACRTVLDVLHRALCTWFAPTLCFTADEAWVARFGEDTSVHLALYPDIPAGWFDPALAARWQAVRDIRRSVTAAIEQARAAGVLGSSLQAAVVVTLPDEGIGLLDAEGWAETAIVSEMSLRHGDEVAASVALAAGRKCARCWRVLPEVGNSAAHPALCLRCLDAVQSGLVCAPVAA